MILDLIIAAADTPPAATPSSGNQMVIAALGAGSVGAILAAVVTGVFSKKKLGAEATEIITKAASGVVENLNAEIIRVTAALNDVRAEQARNDAQHHAEIAKRDAAHARQMDDVRRVLQLHVAWDMLAVAKLAEHNITLPEAPPLLPPLRGEPGE